MVFKTRQLTAFIVIIGMIIGAIHLVGCGNAANTAAEAVARVAIESYVNNVVGDVDITGIEDLVKNRQPELIDGAIDAYFNEPSIQEFGPTVKAKEAVIFTANKLLTDGQAEG